MFEILAIIIVILSRKEIKMLTNVPFKMLLEIYMSNRQIYFNIIKCHEQ